MTIQTLSMEWPFDAEAPDVHCPACGAQVLKKNDAVTQPACAHVKFVYLAEIDDFDYLDARIESQLEERRNAAPDDDLSNGEMLRGLDGPSTCFVYELTTSGMACGPVSSTVRIGFDLAAPGA